MRSVFGYSLRSSISILVVLALFCLIVSACDAPPSSSASSTVVLTPANTSPGTLDVVATINDDQNTLNAQNDIDMHLSTTQVVTPSPNTVQLLSGENITCNGTLLGFNGTDYAVSVSMQQGAYICTYKWVGGTVRVPMPAREPLNPTLAKGSGKLSVGYNPAGGNGCTFEVDASGGAGSASASSKGNDGNITNIDVSTLSGQGSMTLTRTCTSTPGSSFNTITETYTSSVRVSVTWTAATP